MKSNNAISRELLDLRAKLMYYYPYLWETIWSVFVSKDNRLHIGKVITLLYGPLMTIAYNVHRIFLAIVRIMIKSSFYVLWCDSPWRGRIRPKWYCLGNTHSINLEVIRGGCVCTDQWIVYDTRTVPRRAADTKRTLVPDYSAIVYWFRWTA
jgi:hypothetical protein